MSEIKHTPGPWFYDARDGLIHQKDEVEALIATVNFENCSETHAGFDGELIAAAPDLLAAAKQVLKANNPAPHGDHHSQSAIEARAKAWSDLTQAIAKAEGGAA